MNQPTQINTALPTPQTVVVAAQMKARREELQRLLIGPNASHAASGGQSSDTHDAQQYEGRDSAVNFKADKRRTPNAELGHQSQSRSDAPNAVASVLSVIGEGLLQGWWHAHPARAVAQVATSLLSDQARLHPKRLIIAGAVLGSAVVMLKPWRRLNVTKLLLTAVAGGGSGMVAKLLGVASNTQPKDSRPRH